jgi:hypothetical protein
MKKLSLAVTALLATVAPAAAQTPVPVRAFDSIELQGGGSVTIRHGVTQRVTLVRGSTDMTGFTVDEDGTLEIEACIRSCSDYDLEVEIVTPGLGAIAIHGGGSIRAQGNFPARDDLAVAIHGGGSIDVRAIVANDVAASIRGGGSIRTHAEDNLAASIQGGGSVTYWGDPERAVSINGGGTVNAGGR